MGLSLSIVLHLGIDTQTLTRPKTRDTPLCAQTFTPFSVLIQLYVVPNNAALFLFPARPAARWTRHALRLRLKPSVTSDAGPAIHQRAMRRCWRCGLGLLHTGYITHCAPLFVNGCCVAGDETEQGRRVTRDTGPSDNGYAQKRRAQPGVGRTECVVCCVQSLGLRDFSSTLVHSGQDKWVGSRLVICVGARSG